MTFNLCPFSKQLAVGPENMRDLLTAAADLFAMDGPGRTNAERGLLDQLACIASLCRQWLEESGIGTVADGRDSIPGEDPPALQVLKMLAAHAMRCLDYRRSRDAFGGRRRIVAFQILSEAAEYMNLPEAVSLAEKLETSGRNDGVAAADFLRRYHKVREEPEPPADTKILQLRITLCEIKPPIWRRILVPNDLLLGDLPYIINRAMGWGGFHMHAFKFGGGFGAIVYAGSQTIDDCDPSIRDEDSVTLASLIKRKGQAFSYEYDFGDGWEHQVKVEKILPFDPALKLPVCLGGERACPPEDCGGVPGYCSILEALKNKDNPELQGFRDWIGSFNPEGFNLDKINRRLEAVE